MSMTLTHTLAVCECCAVLIANADESGCRDYYGHTHPAADVPAGTVLTDDGADQPSIPWTCEACRTEQDRFAYRMWADVLETEHRHTYRADLSTHWCEECDTCADYCQQINPS